MRTLLLALFASAAVTSAAQTEETELQAWIETHERDGMIELVSMARAAGPVSLRYSLSVERVSNSGRSQSSQNGEVTLSGPEAKELSRSAVNAVDEGYLLATLTIVDQHGNEASDRIELGEQN